MILKFLFVLFLIFSIKNNFIENEFVNVLTNWTLLEETKKKRFMRFLLKLKIKKIKISII